MDGFWDGVQYYNQQHHTNVQVLGWNEKTQNGSFTGDFTNQTKGQTLTQTFISEGADVIFPVAGQRRPGRGQGGPERGRRGRAEGQHAVGGHRRLHQRRAVLQVLHHQRDQGHPGAVKAAVLSAANGTFKGGNYIGTLANGGVVLSPFHDFASKVPASLQSELNTIKQRSSAARSSRHQEPGLIRRQPDGQVRSRPWPAAWASRPRLA